MSLSISSSVFQRLFFHVVDNHNVILGYPNRDTVRDLINKFRGTDIIELQLWKGVANGFSGCLKTRDCLLQGTNNSLQAYWMKTFLYIAFPFEIFLDDTSIFPHARQLTLQAKLPKHQFNRTKPPLASTQYKARQFQFLRVRVFLQKFSRYKNCLSDRRRRFSFDNLREYIVVYCNAVYKCELKTNVSAVRQGNFCHAAHDFHAETEYKYHRSACRFSTLCRKQIASLPSSSTQVAKRLDCRFPTLGNPVGIPLDPSGICGIGDCRYRMLNYVFLISVVDVDIVVRNACLSLRSTIEYVNDDNNGDIMNKEYSKENNDVHKQCDYNNELIFKSYKSIEYENYDNNGDEINSEYNNENNDVDKKYDYDNEYVIKAIGNVNNYDNDDKLNYKDNTENEYDDKEYYHDNKDCIQTIEYENDDNNGDGINKKYSNEYNNGP
ncbi:hypothetical protein ANN_11632 [Periplaneta americana]|uniref:Uncharacterized protein n=1 Tax=Periplaneta americana TaxID=6978 RepID=A0ABQ8T5K1_PERAM|nr:hypothetical protein ANN_11632 [Periplaneta americana]